MSTVPRFLMRDLVGPQGHFHAVRHKYPPKGSSQRHDHDFAEVLWLDDGMGTHFVNGKREHLEKGFLRFIRPDDRHEIVSSGSHPLRLSNVAFPSEILEWLAREFPQEAGYQWQQWLDGSRILLDDSRLTTLGLLFDRLAASPQSRLPILRFLIDLVDLLQRAAHAVYGRGGAPAWFSRAVDEISEHPVLLREGLTALARVAERSTDHVNRTCRRYLGKTATDIVNEMRLEQAARLLRSSDQEVVDVAYRCGFENLSHFYHLFKSHYGMPPARFRNRELNIIRTQRKGARDYPVNRSRTAG